MTSENNLKTVFEILLNEISTPEFSIKLNQNEIDYVKNLIESDSEVFSKIHNHIDNIMADGMVNCNDIPEIVLLVSDIYHLHIETNIIEDIGVANIVRFTLNAIIASGILPIPKKEFQVAKKLIDVSVNLLVKNVKIKEYTGVCCNFFSKFLHIHF
jgi:hypothetical protein